MNQITREAQVHNREVMCERSVDQTDELMDKNVIEGSAPWASVPSDAKPILGSRRRVNDAFARWKLAFLSGEASWTSGDGLDVPLNRRSLCSNAEVGHEESAEGIVAQ